MLNSIKFIFAVLAVLNLLLLCPMSKSVVEYSLQMVMLSLFRFYCRWTSKFNAFYCHLYGKYNKNLIYWPVSLSSVKNSFLWVSECRLFSVYHVQIRNWKVESNISIVLFSHREILQWSHSLFFLSSLLLWLCSSVDTFNLFDHSCENLSAKERRRILN